MSYCGLTKVVNGPVVQARTRPEKPRAPDQPTTLELSLTTFCVEELAALKSADQYLEWSGAWLRTKFVLTIKVVLTFDLKSFVTLS